MSKVVIDFAGTDPIKTRIIQKMAEDYIRNVRAVLSIDKDDAVHVLIADAPEGMALFIGHEPPATTDNFYQAPQAKA